MFYPLDRLQALRAFERGQANAPARDHFFHTLNNFFLGLIVLDGMSGDRDDNAFPDALIAKNRKRSKLKFWEALWFTTVIFHDPGYIPENFWSLVDFAYGLAHDPSRDVAIPPEVKQRIVNAWNTQFVPARKKISSVYGRAQQSAAGTRTTSSTATAARFDDAARTAYFDGTWTGHSVISGLTLIYQCMVDDTSPHQYFDRDTAVEACSVASLSMLFHDQHCRQKLAAAGISPVAFESLPYAATLMFVDCLQDERRERNRSTFPRIDVLESIKIVPSSNIVTARICLPRLAYDGWPKRIAEYENVMRWVNFASRAKFVVDYTR